MVQAINTHSTTAPIGRRIEYAWRTLPRSNSLLFRVILGAVSAAFGSIAVLALS
jgi:hypothetical protein